MRPSSCPRSVELALTLLACGACASQGESQGESAPVAQATLVFEFSHDNSVAERWPFGLDSVTTKIVAEPARADAVAESYWVVRSSGPYAGALTAELALRAEFPGTRFEPVLGADYELVTGPDKSGSVTGVLASGMFEVRMPASDGSRQAGFSIRARFSGDDVRQEPPKALLLELLRVRDSEGRELALGETRSARWLIVDPDSSPVREPNER